MAMKCSGAANYVPLTPISFLERAAHVYADSTSIVYYGTGVRFSWRETHQICLNLASALSAHFNLSRGDIVAAMAPNIPALYNLHFAVPMAGAVLSALNTSLDAATLASILEQLEPKIIFVDYQFVGLVQKAFDRTLASDNSVKAAPLLVIIPECGLDQPMASWPSVSNNLPSGSLDYNDLLEMGNSDFEIVQPNHECDPISVNYTSGSTGNPKGVVYSHRGAYLNSLAQITRCEMKEETPVFLWSVDMFRCNGWCCTWATAAVGGTNVCLRTVSAKSILDSILLHDVTHICGQPRILKMIANASSTDQKPLPRKVSIVVAGVLPTTQILEQVVNFGFNILHAYGMTEVLGPAIVRTWKPQCQWDTAPSDEKIKLRQGLNNLLIQGVDVKDPSSMKSVPQDGTTVGEVMFRANTVMLEYFKNPKATEEAFRDGWFHTGDLAVRNPNGYIQMKDRKKDIIISGAEIISSLEVEAVLLSNPKVLEAAVVGKGDARLKEVPVAFVRLNEACEASPEELLQYCAYVLPSYMLPRAVVFDDIPVNSNGKVQKFVLREKANAIDLGGGLSIQNGIMF